MGWNYRLLEQDLNTAGFGQEADRLRERRDKEFVYRFHEVMKQQGYAHRNEGRISAVMRARRPRTKSGPIFFGCFPGSRSFGCTCTSATRKGAYHWWNKAQSRSKPCFGQTSRAVKGMKMEAAKQESLIPLRKRPIGPADAVARRFGCTRPLMKLKLICRSRLPCLIG